MPACSIVCAGPGCALRGPTVAEPGHPGAWDRPAPTARASPIAANIAAAGAGAGAGAGAAAGAAAPAAAPAAGAASATAANTAATPPLALPPPLPPPLSPPLLLPLLPFGRRRCCSRHRVRPAPVLPLLLVLCLLLPVLLSVPLRPVARDVGCGGRRRPGGQPLSHLRRFGGAARHGLCPGRRTPAHRRPTAPAGGPGGVRAALRGRNAGGGDHLRSEASRRGAVPSREAGCPPPVGA